MKNLDRLAKLEATFQRKRTNDMHRTVWERLFLTLRAEMTSGGASYFPAIVALRERMESQCVTPADRAALASLRTDDLAEVGATPNYVVHMAYEALNKY